MAEIFSKEFKGDKKLHVVKYHEAASEFDFSDDNSRFDHHVKSDPEYIATGWDFDHSSDPELWTFSDRLLKPGGTVLDLGIGEARNSFYFALNGMDVLGIEGDSWHFDGIREMAEEMSEIIPGKFDLQKGDITSMDIPKDAFDVVLLNWVIHLPSRERALGLIMRAYEAVAPGGHIYLRMVSKNMSEYQEALKAAESGSGQYNVVDNGHVVESMCGCSGVEQMEPTVYLDPMDPHALLVDSGARIIHSQTIPTMGRSNIVFGEDHKLQYQYPDRSVGYITLIAQKPELVE